MNRASALSLTAWRTSSTSVLVTDEDRLDVVELGAADDLVVVAVGDGHGGAPSEVDGEGGMAGADGRGTPGPTPRRRGRRRRSGRGSRRCVRRASTSIDARAARPRSRYGSASGARKAVAKRMIRGRPSTVSWPSTRAGLGGQHQGEVVVGAQLLGGADDGAHEQVLERVGALDLRRAGRRRTPPARGPAGPRTGRPCRPGTCGRSSPATRRTSAAMSSIGDLGDAPALAAALGGVEHAVLERPSPACCETIRRKPSHCQGRCTFSVASAQRARRQ